MRQRIDRRIATLGVALALCAAGRAAAQPADTVVVVTEGTLLARFEDARAVAVDPSGKFYVADAGRDVIVQLSAAGDVIATLGGPGSGEGRFDGPADIDPTNGLVLIVADAGNGRLQRFSSEFLHLASMPVGRGVGEVGGPAGEPPLRPARGGAAAFADGRPIAVISTPSNEIFAVDAGQNLVLKWDSGRRFERVIGGYEEAEGALVEPVALALDPRRSLYVADRGRAAVVVYDLFGGYMRTLAEGLARDVQALTVQDDHLWVVLPGRLLVYETRGRLARVIDVALGEPLVDVAHHRGTTYLLTPTRLYRAAVR